MLWGWPFPVLASIVKIALWIAFVAGGIAALSAFIAGYVGYELAEAMQKEADLRIVEARSRGEEARASAAIAEQRALKLMLVRLRPNWPSKSSRPREHCRHNSYKNCQKHLSHGLDKRFRSL